MEKANEGIKSPCEIYGRVFAKSKVIDESKIVNQSVGMEQKVR